MESAAWDRLDGVKLSSSTRKTLARLGFDEPTPVQAACIPLFLRNKDVAAEAVTGSGKTLAFVMPILEILMAARRPASKASAQSSLWRKQEVGAVIITPTRELAMQIHEVIAEFLADLEADQDQERRVQLSHILFIGGKNPALDVERFKLNGGNIVIATPGRFEDLLTTRKFGSDFNMAASVKSLEVLVLDEADRLLDMGFEKTLNVILSYLPKQRRTGLFSATQTREVEAMIRAGLRNPVCISVKEKQMSSMAVDDALQQKTPRTLKNFYMVCQPETKFNTLIALLKKWRDLKLMVFFSTRRSVEYFTRAISELMQDNDTVVLSMHGTMKNKRFRAFDEFRNISKGILICTDVMARGVDIPEVHWVIQYDPPSSASAFVHRCGRTARMGNRGNALLLLLPNEDSYIKFLEINQKVMVVEKKQKLTHVPDVLQTVRKVAMKEREFFEMSKKAFVSFIRAYKGHECRVIFRVKDLDFGALATGYGLVAMPKMSELKGVEIKNFQPHVADVNMIPFLDEAKERNRQHQLASFMRTGVWPYQKARPIKSVPWSKTKENELKHKEKRLKKLKSKQQELKGIEAGFMSAIKRKRKKRSRLDKNDLKELADDIRLIKKLKQKKISEAQFTERFVDKEATPIKVKPGDEAKGESITLKRQRLVAKDSSSNLTRQNEVACGVEAAADGRKVERTSSGKRRRFARKRRRLNESETNPVPIKSK